jgi:hypothetical protein
MHHLRSVTVEFRKRFGVGLTVFLALLSVGVIGCTQKVEMKKVDLMSGTSQEEKDQIKKYLEAAGNNGEIKSIIPDGDTWVVEVGSPPGKAGERPRPLPPEPVRISKKDGKIVQGPDSVAE